MILDIFGDALSISNVLPATWKSSSRCTVIAMPISLIYRVRIRWQQKIGLTATLCLTIIMIVTTTIRVSGVKDSEGALDSLWEDFWNIVSSEVGIIMTAATAFRALFVSRDAATRERSPSMKFAIPKFLLPSTWQQLLHEGKHYLFSWRITRSSSRVKSSPREDSDPGNERTAWHLPSIPRAHMTGVRTFIRGQGRRSAILNASQIMQTQIDESDRGQSDPDWMAQKIVVHHDLSSRSEKIDCMHCNPPVGVPCVCGRSSQQHKIESV